MPVEDGLAPQDDGERSLVVVLGGDARHLAVEAERGGGAGRRADVARQPRGAEAAKQDGVGRVLRHQAVRSAVAERQDGLSPEGRLRLGHARGNQVHGCGPGEALELPNALGSRALRSHAPRRVKQAVLAVEVAGDAADLGADETVRQRMPDIRRRRPDLGDPTVPDLDLERAGVGAVERAGGVMEGRLRRLGWNRIGDCHAGSVHACPASRLRFALPGLSPVRDQHGRTP